MLAQKQAEEAIVSNISEADHEGKEDKEEDDSFFSLRSALWHGGSVWDAWFSCASNQVKPHTGGKLVLVLFFSLFFLEFQAQESNKHLLVMVIAGSTSSVDTSLLLLSVGYALWNHTPGVLRPIGKLDSLPHQCSLHRVSKSEGEREC